MKSLTIALFLTLASTLCGQDYDTIYSKDATKPIVIIDKANKSRYQIEEVLWTSSPGVAEIRSFVYADTNKRVLSIVKVPIVFHGKRPDTNSQFRYKLLLYAINSDNTPGNQLEPHNYILSAAEPNFSELVFDVSHYKIQVPAEGLFVGIEALNVPVGYYDVVRKENVKKFTSDFHKLKLMRWGATYTRLRYRSKAPQTFSWFRHPKIRDGIWQKNTLEDLNCTVVFSD